MTWVAAARPLQELHDLLVLDLDGVVYVGEHAVPAAVDALTAARRAGLALRYVTNNAARPPREVAAHLQVLGLPAGPEDVVTSSQAAARLVLERCGAGARVLAVGGQGVRTALQEVGLEPVGSAEDRPVAVVQGYGADVGWRQLAEAAFAVRAGALWVATNTDPTLPTPRGPAPGNGSLVAAVRTATGQEPLVAGKPEPALFAVAAGSAAAPLVVGDRLDTDIAAGRRAGMATLLVLTGVTGWPELLRARPLERPDFLAADLRGLARPHAAGCAEQDGWRCGPASARVRAGRLQLDPGTDSPDGLDPLRAAAAAAWAAADDGSPWILDPAARRWLEAEVPGGR